MNFFSKIFGTKHESQNNKLEIKEKFVIKKAKVNTFDISFFKNDIDGKFVFPKYNRIKSIVKISDKTNYKETYNCDKNDILNFTFNNFEDYQALLEPEIEVEDFQTLFNKRELNGLPVLSKLKGQNELIEIILNSIENQTYEPFYPSGDIQKQLLKYRFIEIIDLDRNNYIEFIRENILFDDLKVLCNKNDIKIGKTKSIAIDNLLNANIDLPQAFMITSEFIKYIDDLTKFYISDIESTIRLMHPLYHKFIWEEALCINDFSKIESLINSKLEEAKWETLLEPKYPLK